MSGEVVYGRNSVRELIAAARRPVHDIWSLPSLRGEPWLADQPVSERSRAEIGRAAGSGSHQGIVAFTDPYPYASSAWYAPASASLSGSSLWTYGTPRSSSRCLTYRRTRPVRSTSSRSIRSWASASR